MSEPTTPWDPDTIAKALNDARNELAALVRAAQNGSPIEPKTPITDQEREMVDRIFAATRTTASLPVDDVEALDKTAVVPSINCPRPGTHHSDGIVKRGLGKDEYGVIGVNSMFIVPPGVAFIATAEGPVSMPISEFPDWWEANAELLGYVDPVASLDDEGSPAEGEGNAEHAAVTDPAEKPSSTADHEADPAPDVEHPADDGSSATLPFEEHGQD